MEIAGVLTPRPFWLVCYRSKYCAYGDVGGLIGLWRSYNFMVVSPLPSFQYVRFFAEAGAR